jgi:asparagine synthase (glutamine-hydrolysing)
VSGIIGKLSFEQHETLARPVLEQMLDAVAHRGESRRDIHAAPGIALGASVVGATATTWVVADSRLVNARDLRAELRRHGRQVTEPDDAHLIAQAYEVWGEQCFARLEGPCACAVWDSRTRRLLLSRDAIGIKPLYFALLHAHGVVFASEIKALFHDPGVPREYSPEGIDAYLTLGYVPAPLTAFRRISKVEPGQFIVIDGRRLHAEQYWDVPAQPVTRVADALATVETGLRLALRGDGHDAASPVLFSGGVASATLLAASPAGTTALTVAIDQEASELTRADAVARRLGQTSTIEVATLDAPSLAKDLASRFDEPIADPWALAQHASCVATRQHGAGSSRPTAIAGHGASALFGSAPRRTVWDGEHRRSLYTRAFASEVRDTDPRARYQDLCRARGSADINERSMYVQLRSVLPDSTLLVADRVSLAAGVSLRLPFLDRTFVETVAAIPASERLAGHGPLPLLQRLIDARLPAAGIPPARPAAAPSWLRHSLHALVPPVLLSPRFDGRGIVSRVALRSLWDEHRSGRTDHALRFWSLLMLEFWFRGCLDGDALEEPIEYALLKAA